MKAYDVTSPDEKEDFLDGEYVRRVIEETIEFDEKMRDSEFLRNIRLEEEKIRNIDLAALLERSENEGDGVSNGEM